MPNPSVYFKGKFSTLAPQACLIVSTSPIFGGITSLVANTNGSLTASWSAATGSALSPIRYRVYIQATTATGLFSTVFVRDVSSLTTTIFMDNLANLLSAGVTYYVAVRAISANNIIETNVVTMSAVSQGVVADSLGNIVTAIKIQTDKFSFDGSNYVNAHTKVNDDKTGYTLTPAEQDAIVTKIWAALQSANTAVGSFGAALQGVLTAARANNLDNLDVQVSTRAVQSNLVALQSAVALIPTNPLLTNDSRLNNLDAQISLVQTAATALSQYNTLLGGVQGIQNNTSFVAIVPNLMDIPEVGSETYTIYVKTYNDLGAPIDPVSNIINMTVKDSQGVTLKPLSAMTRVGVGNYTGTYTVSFSDADADAVFFFNYSIGAQAYEQVRMSKIAAYSDELQILISRLTNARAMALDLLPSIASQTGQLQYDGMGNVLSSAEVVHDKTGYALTNTDKLAIADRVWTSLLAAYTTPGQAGYILNTLGAGSTPTGVAAAVWDMVRAAHATSGSFGEALQGVLSAARAAKIDFLDASILSRASQQSLDDDFGNMSTLVTNLQTTSSNLQTTSASIATTEGELQTDVSDLGVIKTSLDSSAVSLAQTSIDVAATEVLLAQDVADVSAAAAATAAAAAATTAAAALLTTDIDKLEKATAEMTDNANIFAVSNLTGNIGEDSVALNGTVKEEEI